MQRKFDKITNVENVCQNKAMIKTAVAMNITKIHLLPMILVLDPLLLFALKQIERCVHLQRRQYPSDMEIAKIDSLKAFK